MPTRGYGISNLAIISNLANITNKKFRGGQSFAMNFFVVVFQVSLRAELRKALQTIKLGVIKPAWNNPKTSQAKPGQAGLAWLVLQKRGSWLGLAWLVNSKRGHRLGFDLAKNSLAWVGFDMILDHFNI